MTEPAGAGFDQSKVHRARLDRVRSAMDEHHVDVLVLSLGADLPWLSGYEAMPLERPTALVVPRDGEAELFVPELEAPRVRDDPDLFALRAWRESEDPIARIAASIGRPARIAISDRAWAGLLLDLQGACPGVEFVRASKVTGPIRAVKDAVEIAALEAAGASADRVAEALLSGSIPLVGRSEREVSEEIGRRLVEAGHRQVNFAIVGSGPNSASPHHEPGERRLQLGDAVVCDFGGVLSIDDGVGYCSDTTRTVVLGEPSARFRELYSVLQEAQQLAVEGVRPGIAAEEIDRIGRDHIAAAGFGDAFIHRIGHGIGIEEHEDPYIVSGNRTVLVPGHAFSVEPGIYLAGDTGARIEDIVVVSEDGVVACNRSSRDLVALDV